MSQEEIKNLATNRKAFHNYHILEKHEAGIVLKGTEVKSAREAKINLKDSYAAVKDGELYVFNMHISPYHHGTAFNHEPLRTRKLLLHRKEIDKLTGKIKERGLTLIPLKVYLKRGQIKVEIALVKGKKLYDRREVIAKRDMDREMQRELKYKSRYQ
ncbi:MAG TPA: SsrA-binding protein SmpB [Bacteroidetes bacterium]|nr:SsrA-binding protein SmpB [Bacteroidota bacterium]